MAKINRVIWIVLDSVGIGELPDADKFSDVGANTLEHTWEANKGLKIPNLIKLGLGNINNSTIEVSDSPIGAYGKCAEISAGKDTTIGHWEMAGIYSSKPFPVYPNGFPKEIIDKFIECTGVPGILCNLPASGTQIIEELGEEHIATKKPIIYTSGDSVFQIACHEEVYSVDELYEMCKTARKILSGNHSVARVIARPFVGSTGSFKRTANRRDFSMKPDENNILSIVANAGYQVVGIGKIEDIFAGVGITEAIHTRDNMHGVDVTIDCIKNKKNKGIIFTNLVEFDSTWGHRRDYVGYGKGLEEFDCRLNEIISLLEDDDCLIITADHGCDPTFKGTDHTREYIPLLIYGKNLKNNINLGIRNTYADIACSVADFLGVSNTGIGESFTALL